MHSVLQVFCIECGLGGLEKHDGSVGNCRDEVKPFVGQELDGFVSIARTYREMASAPMT